MARDTNPVPQRRSDGADSYAPARVLAPRRAASRQTSKSTASSEGTPTRVLGTYAAFPLGVGAGVLAGLAMLAWQATVGEVANEATAVPAVNSSVVTMANAITAFFFGPEHFGEGYRYAMYPGLFIHFFVAMAFGALGTFLIVLIGGVRPSAITGVLLGVLYGLFLQILLLNVVINQIQDVDTVYTSTPEWSWWAAHVLYGGLLGFIASRWLRGLAPTVAALEDGDT